jgi:hypothetical protein
MRGHCLPQSGHAASSMPAAKVTHGRPSTGPCAGVGHRCMCAGHFAHCSAEGGGTARATAAGRRPLLPGAAGAGGARPPSPADLPAPGWQPIRLCCGALYTICSGCASGTGASSSLSLSPAGPASAATAAAFCLFLPPPLSSADLMRFVELLARASGAVASGAAAAAFAVDRTAAAWTRATASFVASSA